MSRADYHVGLTIEHLTKEALGHCSLLEKNSGQREKEPKENGSLWKRSRASPMSRDTNHALI